MTTPVTGVEIDAAMEAELTPSCEGRVLSPSHLAPTPDCANPAAWITYFRGCANAAGPWLFCQAHYQHLVDYRRSIRCS